MRYVLFLILLSFKVGAQTPNFLLLDADNSNTVVTNNYTYLHTVAGNASSTHNFSVSNTAAFSQTVIVKRFTQYLNTISVSDLATAPFSYNLINFPPATYSASAVVAAGQKLQFNADLYEASIAGPSEVHYKFMDASDTTKAIKVLLKYNVSTGVINNFRNDQFRVFPNPVGVGETIYFNTPAELKSMELTNASGQSALRIAPINKNEFSTNGLTPGMYFLKIETGQGAGFEKLIISP